MKEAVIKLTDRCPCHCSFCESGNGQFVTHQDVSAERIMTFAGQLISEGLKICVISGGEPLLRSELANNLIDFLHSAGVYVVLNASGVLFINSSINDYVYNYPDLIVFSLDSASEETHDGHRGVKGLYSAIKKTINEIRNNPRIRMSVGIRFVMTRNNFRDLGDIISLCSKWGVDCLKITNIENDAVGHYSLTESQGENLFNTVIPNALEKIKESDFEEESLRMDAMKKIELFMSGMSPADLHSNLFSKNIESMSECPLRSKFVLVGGDGMIFPCCESEHHRFPILGTEGITDMQTIKACLEKLRFQRLDYCKRCTLQRNIQINYTSRCLIVNDRCEQ